MFDTLRVIVLFARNCVETLLYTQNSPQWEGQLQTVVQGASGGDIQSAGLSRLIRMA